MSRVSWDEYFMNIMHEVSKRATCDRGKSACVIVKDKRIITTGYVGAPIGLPHCDEEGHLMKSVYDEAGKESKHCVRTTHAEQNAVAQAARFGISVDGSTLYCTMEPCLSCAKLLINCGIKRVVCDKLYHSGEETREFLRLAGVELVCISGEVMSYDHQ